METTRFDTGALVAGLLFIALGVMFLADRLDFWTFRAVYVWPLLLIGLGLAVLAGGRSRA